MIYYFALSFFFSLIMLFLSLIHDRVFLYDIGYFKTKELSKWESFFLFYHSRYQKMSNIAYFFQVTMYFFFLGSLLLTTILSLLQLEGNQEVIAAYNTFFTYSFYVVIVYFLGNLIIYKILSRIH